MLQAIAKKHNLLYVDINEVYRKVIFGEFVDNNGVTVDPSYPDGNFFSSDGVSLTALGNAIITNETIKEVNSGYGSKVPLLNTKLFVTK